MIRGMYQSLKQSAEIIYIFLNDVSLKNILYNYFKGYMTSRVTNHIVANMANKMLQDFSNLAYIVIFPSSSQKSTLHNEIKN